MPALLEQWLKDNMPVDFTVKQRTRLRMKFIEVTITGDTPEDIQSKRVAFAKVVHAGGFRGVVMKDKRIKKI